MKKQNIYLRECKEIKKQKANAINNVRLIVSRITDQYLVHDNLLEIIFTNDNNSPIFIDDEKMAETSNLSKIKKPSGIQCSFSTLIAGGTYSISNKFTIPIWINHLSQKLVSMKDEKHF